MSSGTWWRSRLAKTKHLTPTRRKNPRTRGTQSPLNQRRRQKTTNHPKRRSRLVVTLRNSARPVSNRPTRRRSSFIAKAINNSLPATTTLRHRLRNHHGSFSAKAKRQRKPPPIRLVRPGQPDLFPETATNRQPQRNKRRTPSTGRQRRRDQHRCRFFHASRNKKRANPTVQFSNM